MDRSRRRFLEAVQRTLSQVIGVQPVDIGNGRGKPAIDAEGGPRHASAFHPLLQIIDDDLEARAPG